MMDWEATKVTTDGGGGEEEVDSRLGLGGVLDDVKKDPIGQTIWPASLLPPSLTGGDDPISYVLVDVHAYIADRENATTAKSFTRGRHEIQATLCAVRPPRVSYLCVYCPALTPSDFGTEPHILATTDDLILFQAAICKSYFCDEQVLQDFFIYHPAHPMVGPSSLTRLPHPGSDCCFGISEFGLLRHDNLLTLRPHSLPRPKYVVAMLCKRSCKLGETHQFHLHRFRSGDSWWTTTVLPFTPTEASRGLTFFSHKTEKVITLGDGFMGWVDLCQGILLCNVLVDEPELHFIPLPQLLESDRDLQDYGRVVRDVAVVNGYIKYVEHVTQCTKELPSGLDVCDNWRVAMSSWKINLDSWKGHWQGRLDCDGSSIVGSVSDLLGYKLSTPLPHLRRLHTGVPRISLEDDDIVFFLAKVNGKSFVLGVNMRKGQIEGADWFNSERMIRTNFAQMSISHYLPPGRRSKLNKRIGELLGSSIIKKHGDGAVTVMSYRDS